MRSTAGSDSSTLFIFGRRRLSSSFVFAFSSSFTEVMEPPRQSQSTSHIQYLIFNNRAHIHNKFLHECAVIKPDYLHIQGGKNQSSRKDRKQEKAVKE
jgi:hypothetical protein